MKKLILISTLLISFNCWALSDYQPYDETANAQNDIADAINLAEKIKRANSNTKIVFESISKKRSKIIILL